MIKYKKDKLTILKTMWLNLHNYGEDVVDVRFYTEQDCHFLPNTNDFELILETQLSYETS